MKKNKITNASLLFEGVCFKHSLLGFMVLFLLGMSGCSQWPLNDKEPSQKSSEPTQSQSEEKVPSSSSKKTPSSPATKPQKKPVEKTPDWVNTPPIEDENYLYGLGEGNTQKAAFQAGLTALNAQFVQTVKASATPNDRGAPVSLSRSVMSDASADFKGLPLDQYEPVVEAWKHFNSVHSYALVRVSKKALASHLNTQFEMMRADFNEKRHQMEPGLNKWLFYTRQLNLWHGQLEELTALNYLNEDMARSYLLFLTAVKAFIFEAQQKVSIQVQALSADAERFAAPFNQYLKRYGFIKPTKKPTDIIKLSVRKQFAQDAGMAVEKDRIELLKEASLQTRMWHFDVEGADVMPEKAHEKAVQNWTQLLEKQPLGDLLR